LDRFAFAAVYQLPLPAMKSLRLLLLFGALTGVALAAPITAVSSITAATVYADRAVVTRTARIDLPAGQSELTFAGLPAELSDQSLQVAGRGTAATILDVNARVVYTEKTSDPRVLAAEADLNGLQHQDRVLKDKAAALDQQRALLAKIETAVTQPPAKDATVPRPSFDDWQKLLTFSSDNSARLTADRQTLDNDREALALKITAAQARLDELRGNQTGRLATKTVTVRVAAPQAGSLDVSLAYAVNGASWTPAYDARLHTEERTVALTYFGVVRNATGEDWKDIALTLSTARPNLGGSAPELYPWIVDVLRPMAGTARGAGYMSESSKKRDLGQLQLFNNSVAVAGALGGDPFGSNEPAVADSTVATAIVDTAATSASFKIPTAATILSDNTPQKVGIANVTLAAKLQYQATPKQLETAFLSAYVTNNTDYPLLAGTLSTFLDDTFVATSRLKTVMPTEKFELALGADEGIAIKRKLVSRFTEDTGFTTKSKRTTYEFLIILTNHKRTTERVVFKDATPISRDEKIVVKLLTPAERDLLKPEEAAAQPPKLGVSRDTDGKLLWRLDLKPGEKLEIPVKFSIEHPADLPVTGVE
jgi:uncharacterized protein (TIGR02231 family)